MVTSLHIDNESVTVEWIESGDTKGKEVLLPRSDSIMHYSIHRCARSFTYDLVLKINQELLCAYLLNKAELTLS